MAAISLRDYVREIEKQVDGSRNEEAIAHSRHVLESFPKHVDVYRLLGKAYLESQRYGDAGDIFQRVLSAVPEDFVSHVGMSIIREDEGNLDEAIWHMERAFDVQPSNSAIQEELRRLYGRRDNVEPPKIRLTRGALARMYYRGELYPQAIAELRAALNENPDRLDLQVLLAEVYAQAGQRIEAVDMASQVLRRLPYCLAANRIMVNMLAGTDRESEIETYYQRLCQLDPYAAHINAAAPRSEDVPDQAIRLNKLDYKATQTVEAGPGQPIWAATLGIEASEMATGREETLPEWLAAGPSPLAKEGEAPEGSQVPAFAGEEAQLAEQELGEPSTAVDQGEQIPDWMKEMGWEPATAESQAFEAAGQFDLEAPITEAEPAEGELATAEIPDWLKAMAPAEALSEIAPKEESEEDIEPWLDQLFPAEPPSGEAQAQKELPFIETGEEPEAKGESWIGAGLVAGVAAAGIAALGDEETPESGETIEPEELLMEAALQEALPEETVVEQAPDWLYEITAEEEVSATEAVEELPDWLRQELAPTSEAAQVEELAEWSTEETTSEKLAGEEAVEGGAIDEGQELPGWLFESEAQEAASPEAAAEPGQELPDWLLESEAPVSEEASAQAAEELPGWLFESAVSEETPAEAEAEFVEAEEGLPDWLLEAASVGGVEEPLEESAKEGEEIPDWLKAAGAVAGGVAAFQSAEWLSEEAEAKEETPQPAAAIEGEMEAEPVEALLAEELPEWLREPAEPSEPKAAEWVFPLAEESELPAEAQQMEAEPSEAEAIEVETPQAEPTQVEAMAAEENPELAEALAWLDLMLTPVDEVEAPAPAAPAIMEEGEAAPAVEQPMDDDAAFAWLESLAARQGAQEALLLKPEERLETPPEWVLQASQEAAETIQAETIAYIEEAPAEAAEGVLETPLLDEQKIATTPETPAATEPPLDEDAAFAWLESLAVRQGAQEALLLEPEERIETPPEWVIAAGATAAADLVADKAQEVFEAQPVEPVAEVEAAETIITTEPEKEVGVETGAAAAPPFEAQVEEPPELPDWLAAPSSETREETLEWTPPPLSRRKYDLNKITLVELERLPGIGFIMAQRVIDYRNTHGPFKKIDDLLNVPEFGVAALEGVRENLFLEAIPETPAPPARIPTQPRPGTGPLVLATGAGLPKEVAQAREHLSEGYVDLALEIYNSLIHSKKHLNWVIEDLSEACNQYPNELYIWQSLGDAYLRSDQTSQALQSYIRAEKLLIQ
jgi:competence ComEA-like helix-hairpin-helix protein